MEYMTVEFSTVTLAGVVRPYVDFQAWIPTGQGLRKGEATASRFTSFQADGRTDKDGNGSITIPVDVAVRLNIADTGSWDVEIASDGTVQYKNPTPIPRIIEVPVVGARGPKGDKGEPGQRGATGPAGPQGPQGVQGPQGIQGLKGDTGDRGAQGDRGDTGARGPKGDPGTGGTTLPAYLQSNTELLHSRAGTLFWEVINEVPDTPDEQSRVGHVLTVTGTDDQDYNWRAPVTSQGPAGPAGPQGPQGVQGNPGRDGAQGPAGARGADGAQGPAGPKGDKGDAGDEPVQIEINPPFPARQTTAHNMYISVRHAVNMFPEADVIRVAPDGANVTLLAYTPGSLQQDFIAEVDARSMGNLTSNGDLDNGDYLAVDIRIQKGRGAEVPIYYQRTIDVPVIAAASGGGGGASKTVVAAIDINNSTALSARTRSFVLPADFNNYRYLQTHWWRQGDGVTEFRFSCAILHAFTGATLNHDRDDVLEYLYTRATRTMSGNRGQVIIQAVLHN